MVRMENEQFQPVPCGKCPPCRARRASGWSFRLMQQAKVSDSSHFITLTYATDKVPISKQGFMSLDKRDVQLFFKRLRKAHNNCQALSNNRQVAAGFEQRSTTPGIKYYVCGEYGDTTHRPHYHAIMFNVRIELIQDAWQNGNVHYGTVNGASIGYTLKYMCKPPSAIGKYEWDDRLPEFSLMSKGLGVNYLTPGIKKYHYDDLENRMYCPLEDGKKIAMPRYYKNKLYDDEQKEAIAYAMFKKAQLEVHPKWSDEQILHYYKTQFNDDQRFRDKL